MNYIWRMLKRDRYAKLLFLIFCLRFQLGSLHEFMADGVGNYVWVRSAIIDRNLDCSNEFDHFIGIFKEKYGWLDATDDLYPIMTKTGLQLKKYPIGTSIRWNPFFSFGAFFHN